MILPRLGQLLLKIHKTVFIVAKTTFESLKKGVVFQMEKGTTKAIWGLEKKAFIHPYIEISELHQTIWNPH